MSRYSNMRAMRSLVKASLQSILKSPSAIIFSVAFPLIFILVFGFLGGGKGFTINVAAAPGSDTTNALYATLKNVPALNWKHYTDTTAMQTAMSEGDLAATLAIRQNEGSPRYSVVVNAASSQMDKAQQLQSIISGAIQQQDPVIRERINELVAVEVTMSAVRDFKMIDFILPGQLGFSLLAAGVFGTAFVFFNLRQTLVLKRFFATPVRREIIVLSEGIARMIFQLTGAVVIIGLGHYVFGYTLINGWLTFLGMLALCALALLVFMGFGFIISGVAKNESSIPPLSNIITLPQFLLAGTFFPIDNFPAWLQPICRMLPLTYLNDALRKVAFDGAGLWEIKWDVIILLGWGVVLYVVASKVFRWE